MEQGQVENNILEIGRFQQMILLIRERIENVEAASSLHLESGNGCNWASSKACPGAATSAGCERRQAACARRLVHLPAGSSMDLTESLLSRGAVKGIFVPCSPYQTSVMASVPKMVEGAFVGPEADAARARLIAAGYDVQSCELKKVAMYYLYDFCVLITRSADPLQRAARLRGAFLDGERLRPMLRWRTAALLELWTTLQASLQPHIHDIDEVRDDCPVWRV